MGLIFFIFFSFLFKKGPPDAVRYIFFIKLWFSDFNNVQIEKCSESKGIKFVLFFLHSLSKNFHPQIIDSLFAVAKFLVYFIICNDGSNPSIPEIAFIVRKDFFLFFFNALFIVEYTLIFFFLNFLRYFYFLFL